MLPGCCLSVIDLGLRSSSSGASASDGGDAFSDLPERAVPLPQVQTAGQGPALAAVVEVLRDEREALTCRREVAAVRDRSLHGGGDVAGGRVEEAGTRTARAPPPAPG